MRIATLPSLSAGETILCDSSRCHAKVVVFAESGVLQPHTTIRSESIICLLCGTMVVHLENDLLTLEAGQGIQIPAGKTWHGDALPDTVVLCLASFHPGFAPSHALTPPLAAPHAFLITQPSPLIYTDYLRGAVLRFAPGWIAELHYHAHADEIFWFLEGICRISTLDTTYVASNGDVVIVDADEWHELTNIGNTPLLIFLVVAPNIVPSHTFRAGDGSHEVRSWQVIRHAPPLHQGTE